MIIFLSGLLGIIVFLVLACIALFGRKWKVALFYSGAALVVFSFLVFAVTLINKLSAIEQILICAAVVITVRIISKYLNRMHHINKVLAQAVEAGAKDGIECSHVEGLGILNAQCRILRFDDRIQIHAVKLKTTFTISYEQMRAIEVKSGRDIVQIAPYAVHSFVGHLFIPGISTIVNRMSDPKMRRNHYLILNFIGSDGELHGITFQNDTDFLGLHRLSLEVSLSCKLSDTATIHL